MIVLLIVLLSLLTIGLCIFVPIFIVNSKYKNFVINHSVALKQLNEINIEYRFKVIPNFNMKHSYDNEIFYHDISCQDYLTYQLVYNQKKVNLAIKDTIENKNIYENYLAKIKEKCLMGKFDNNDLPKNRNKLLKIEDSFFKQNIKKPRTSFSNKLSLTQTNINGRYISSKKATFSVKEIRDIIYKLNKKRGTFYLDNNIWQAICRVERGKVTNKMRFAIYEKDHYRCRKCGRKTNDLEIDHIIPIAKGGKSTFDNLQTLCHKCNCKKGANIDY